MNGVILGVEVRKHMKNRVSQESSNVCSYITHGEMKRINWSLKTLLYTCFPITLLVLLSMLLFVDRVVRTWECHQLPENTGERDSGAKMQRVQAERDQLSDIY